MWCSPNFAYPDRCFHFQYNYIPLHKSSSLLCITRAYSHSLQHIITSLVLFLYKTYVCPHLEYCIPVWSPYLMGDMDELEKVQHRATKRTGEISKLPYEDRLLILQLPLLYAHCLQGGLIETFKILKCFTNINPDILFTRSSYCAARGHSLKLYKREFKQTHSYKNFFSNRVINSWNEIPQYLIDSDSINFLKNRLDNYCTLIGHGYTQRPSAYHWLF